MHATSETYRRLLEDPGHRKEVRVNIAGADYGQDRIVSLETSGGIFSKPDIGVCASRQIDLTLRQPGTIPKSACIKVFVRLALGAQASEWLPKGVFFISTRQWDKSTGALSIHGFDAMRRAGELWQIDPFENWPMPQPQAVERIARQMGVGLDPRTGTLSDIPVGYPVDETGELAMADVLECIATCNAGNWVINDEGKLLLLRLGDIPPETFHLVTEQGKAITLGGVRIRVG